MTLASEGGPRLLVRDVLLRDGSTLRLQAPVPSDFGDIKAFYDGLSPESRCFRFHGYGRTDAAARAEAQASGVDRLALLGRYDGRVVAVASYDGLREPGAAEVSFAAADALLHQAGVLRFRGGEELFDAAVFFESQPLPSGREIGIVSNSPRLATLGANACAARGLQVGQPSQAGNPLVLGISAGPGEYAASIRQLLGDAGIDALTVYYSDRLGGDPEAVLEAICAASAGQPKPVVASVVRSDGLLPARPGPGVPNFLFPRVVRGRARPRGRTPRLAVTAARPASALP